ncbi:MAG: MFS transporter [Pseudomonadales bacterium]|nr:MFS transporter [Pseudomonadales bacterium]
MSGLRLFYFVLFGQTISMLGSSLTNFGVSVWILREYADSDLQTTLYSLTLLASTLPALLVGPFLGSLIDRWPRKLNLIGSQIGAAICTLVIAGFYWSDSLTVWTLLWVLPFASLCGISLQVGFTASVALVVPKESLSRASGSLGLMLGLVQLLGPLLAGILMDQIGLKLIFVLDLVTFLLGLLTLFLVTIPNPEYKPEGKITVKALVNDLVEAYRYMKGKEGVLGGLFLFALIWFNVSAVQALFAPLVLSIGTATDLGMVQMVGGIGLMVGSLVMVAWKGPDRKMVAILIAAALVSIGLAITPITQQIWVLCVGAFMILAIAPLANTSSQVFWQKKTDPAFQGRVFSLRNTMMRAAQPVAFLMAGFLADGYFKPEMAEGRSLATLFGPIWGVGEARGIALMISVFGVVSLVFVVAAAFKSTIRRADSNLPDFDEDDTLKKSPESQVEQGDRVT